MNLSLSTQLIPTVAGASALWSYMQNAPTDQSLIFAVVGVASYAIGARLAAKDLVRELDERVIDARINEVWTSMREQEKEMEERIERTEDRLDTQVDVIMDKIS